MNYKDYQSFEVKNGVIDVFTFELDGKTVVQMFTTDFITWTTSSATFNNVESFQKFIQFLKTMKLE